VKVRGGTTKWVVKEVARQHLPTDIVDRPKVSFKVPPGRLVPGVVGKMLDRSIAPRSQRAAPDLDVAVG
jgi:Asparagine synthase